MNIKAPSNTSVRSDALKPSNLDAKQPMALHLQLRQDMAAWTANTPTTPDVIAAYLNEKRHEPLSITVDPMSGLRVQEDPDGRTLQPAFDQLKSLLSDQQRMQKESGHSGVEPPVGAAIKIVLDKQLVTAGLGRGPVQKCGEAVHTKQPIIPADAVPLSSPLPLPNTVHDYVSACVATAHRTAKPAYISLNGFALVAQPTKDPQAEITRLEKSYTDAAKGVDFRETGFPQKVSVPVNEYLDHVTARQSQIKTHLAVITVFADVEAQLRQRSSGPFTAEQHVLRVLENVPFSDLGAVLNELKKHDTVALGPDAYVFFDFKAVTETLQKKLGTAMASFL